MEDSNSIIIISRIFGVFMLICATLFILKMLNYNFEKGYRKGYKDCKDNKINEYEC